MSESLIIRRRLGCSTLLTGPYVLQCCFIRPGETRDLCEEPALIMHEPRLPGENTTRASERGERSTAGSTNSQIHADSRTGLILTRRAERIAAPWAT